MAACKFTVFLAVALSVFALTQASVSRQVQENSEQGYVSSMMSSMGSIAEMDWRGMVRSVVDTVMNYMAAPVNRQGTAGNSRNFGADMAVHFIETSPTLRGYAETVHDYIRSINHFIN